MPSKYIKYANMFEDIVAHSPNPFAAGYLDGRMVYWNHAFEELTGFNSEELVHMNWIHTLTPEKEESLSRNLKVKTEIVCSDRLLRRKDGTLAAINYTVRQAQYAERDCPLYYCFITDMAAEKELQQALQYQKANLRLNIVIGLIDIISEGVMVFTPEKISRVNLAFTRLTGYKFDEIVGMDFSGFCLSHLTDEQIGKMEEDLRKTGKWRSNITIRHKGGNIFPVMIAINSLHNEKEELICRVAVFTDLTVEEKLKQEQLRLQELNAARQKSASLSAISAGIVHEIAQPLNSIKMIIEGLLYWQGNSGRICALEVWEKLEEAAEEMHRIDEIIRHMRSFASLTENPKLEICNLNNIITRTLGLLSRQLAAHGISVTTELAEELPPVKANLNRLDAVLVNLFTNAMQSLDRVEHPDKEIICRTYPETGYAVLQIIDNGIGIDESILDCIFEPFVTTKASRQGMGLGLSIVHTVITRMGGRVIAGNNPDKGASFTIQLPLI